MTDWSAQLGAVAEGEARVSFDTPTPARQALDTTVVTPLVHLGILEVAGEDAERFLQGQTSAQMSLADGDFAPLTCFCGTKGRMLANAQLLRAGPDRYWLLMARSLLEPLKAHLDKFAVFYKAEMRVREDLAPIGLIGQNAPALLEARFDITPPATWHQCQQDERVVVRHPGPRPRLIALLPVTALEDAWRVLKAQATPVGNAVWCLQDIQAGLGWLGASQQDSYLPQMINWEALGGISFKKGCYTGQEVVARAHFRGQVKKRLVRLTLEGNGLPEVGSELLDADGKRQGEVFAAERDAYDQIELLAVMTTKEVAEPLTVNDVRCQRQRLPYPLERLDPEVLATHKG
ncbi:folate-binding protein YgfZ [Halomonas sp. YLGW01]|uniref:CAF17-like 4Fe-4S cluster assembly/insertion protein YgfZ n=1 Tax=Halomonas sp. YLGW01 TaxID=2773308 RepID=UPI001785C1DC|nr:folate-binding protein YgfZ [Halomonas sp. YLGW01]